MTRQIALVFLACSLLAACGDLEGTFEPACTAFEGDRVTLADGRFEWQKFTDERRLDEDGNIIDPFPGYPLKGRYRISNDVVEFVVVEGKKPDDMYLFKRDADVYLLTREQNAAALSGDGFAACSLRLTATNSPN